MSLSIKSVLAQNRMLQSVSDSWRLDTELLLAEVLDCSRASLHARSDQELEEQQLVQFQSFLQRRFKGEPIAYILGRKEFRDFELKVDNRVLIPRPETELLVERALMLLQGREHEKLMLADLGTGSGAIAIALARQSRNWAVFAVDKSVVALELARENAAASGLANIIFVHSSWFDDMHPCEFDIVVSNPPYVDPSDPHLLHDGLSFEPSMALVAENKGLAEFMKIAHQAPGFLKKGASIVLEHGFSQAESVAEILRQNQFEEISCSQDLAGLDRVTEARKITQSPGGR